MRNLSTFATSGRLGPVPALVVACSLTLSSCSLVASSGKAPTTEIAIGLDVPLTGNLATPGLGIEHSVDIAVAKANATRLVPGVKFTVSALDDSADPKIGLANAGTFVADPRLAGVVGPYNSSVALEMAPVLAQSNLAEISPSNTLPALTWGADYRTRGKVRPYQSYFRTVTSDAIQGPYVARYVRQRLNLDRVAVVSDTKAYGAGLADEFAGEFENGGGQVVLRTKIDPGNTDFSALVADIRKSKAELVYYGGESPEAGPLSAQLKAAGVHIPLAGGDAIHDEDYLRLAGGQAADGDLASADGVAIDNLASAYSFQSAYEKANFAEPAGSFGPYAYDCAWALMLAVKQVKADNGGAIPASPLLRRSVGQALQSLKFFGVTGDIGFDEFGDRYNQIVSVYQARQGKWETLVAYGRLDQPM